LNRGSIIKNEIQNIDNQYVCYLDFIYKKIKFQKKMKIDEGFCLKLAQNSLFRHRDSWQIPCLAV